MQPRKILLASWAPFVGGAEVAIERLAVGLREAGHEVLLVVGTKGEALSRFQDAGIACEFVAQRFTGKLTWPLYWLSRRKLEVLFRQFQPDIVHSNDLPTHQLVGDAARRIGLPRVCHHRWIFDGPAIDWLNKSGADRHLFVSQALMNQLCGASTALANSDCYIVYDGLPLPAVPTEKDRQSAREFLELPQDRSIVLFAGQIIERKGVADLLQAWATLRDWHEKAELYLVGDDLAKDGAYRQEMEQLAEELRLSVHFMGFQKNVPTWLTASDLVMVPSHAEPLGNATLEAMALARPVIGAHVGGIPEMIVHNETGMLIPPKSPTELATAISSLLSNPQRRETMGNAARARCETKFSLDHHVTTVLEHYEVVLREADLASGGR